MLNRTRVTLASLVLICLIFNYWWPQMLFATSNGGSGLGPLLLPLFAGATLAQPVLLSIWGSFSAAAITIRVPMTASLMTGCSFAWLFGFHTIGQLPNLAAPLLLLIALFIFLLTLIALWIFRCFSKRVIRQWGVTVRGRTQFQIASIMIWTAVIAGLLVVGRQIFDSNQLPFPPTAMDAFQIAAATSVLAGIAIVVGLPMTFVTLSEEAQLGWMAILIVVYVLGVPLMAAVLGSLNTNAIGYAYLFAIGLGSTILVGLWTARCLGFRLELDVKAMD